MVQKVWCKNMTDKLPQKDLNTFGFPWQTNLTSWLTKGKRTFSWKKSCEKWEHILQKHQIQFSP